MYNLLLPFCPSEGSEAPLGKKTTNQKARWYWIKEWGRLEDFNQFFYYINKEENLYLKYIFYPQGSLGEALDPHPCLLYKAFLFL
jgi:hypothetical protein